MLNQKLILIILGTAVLVFIAVLAVQPSVKELSVEKTPFNQTTTNLATIIDVYDGVRDIAFSPDGRKVAYVAYTNLGQDFLIINNSVVKSYDFVDKPVFSPNSREIAYKACDTGVVEKCFMVRNDEEIRRYDNVFSPVFSPDSKRLAFFAQKEDKIFPVVNDEKGQFYDWEWWHFGFYSYDIPFISPSVVFSPDNQKTAYGVTEMKAEEREFPTKGFIVIDGQKQEKQHEVVLWPVFSPDSKKLAYIAMENLSFGHRSGLTGGDWFVVLNGEEGKVYDWWEGIESPVFSPDSRQLAYVARKEEKFFIVVNDEEEYQDYEMISSPVFSPDSRQLAFKASRGNKEFVVINGKEGQEYDKIYGKMQFSPDGQYIAYGSKIGDELRWIVEEPEHFKEKEDIDGPLVEKPESFEIQKYAEQLCKKVENKEELSLPKTDIGTIISGSFSSAGTREFFIVCQEPVHPSMYERYFYIIDYAGNVLAERRSGHGRFGSLPFQAIDINNDGVSEIVWAYGIAGGGGTYEHTYAYIYSLKHREFFEMKQEIEWKWVKTAEGRDSRLLLKDETVFSKNLENPQFKLFKDYLLSEGYYQWHRIHGEYKGYEIDDSSFDLEKRLACFAAGTKITMSDNSLKNIEDMKKGDLVRSFNTEAEQIRHAKVIKLIQREDPIIKINDELEAAPDQPIYMSDLSMKMAVELRAGDLLFNEIKVNSIEYLPDKVETYDLILKDAVNFFADGYLVRSPE